MSRRKVPDAAGSSSADRVAELEKVRAQQRARVVERAEKRALSEEARKSAAAGKPKTKTELIAAYGLDRILDETEACVPFEQIAADIGCSRRLLAMWIAEDSNRVAALREARLEAGHRWATKAAEVLEALHPEATQAEVARARELASHYRWAAKMSNRGHYGDQAEIKVKTEVEDMTDEALDAELTQRLTNSGISPEAVAAFVGKPH